MGFFDRLTGTKQTALSETVVHVQLTEIGEKKLRDMHFTGRKFDVMSAIKKLQPCNKKEVAAEIQWPENKVKYLMEELFVDKYLEKVS